MNSWLYRAFLAQFISPCFVLGLLSPKGTFNPKPRTCTQLYAKAEPGSVVTVECKLFPEGEFVPEPLIDGIVIHDNDPPQRLVFLLREGNYLPGLHDLVSNMEEGEVIENVSLDAGWGSWNPNLQASMSFDSLENSGVDSSLIKEGVELRLANGAVAVVKEVTEDKFVIDANPPMAGASYSAYVKLLEVEPGPVDWYSPDAGSDSKYQVATFALGE
jgi:FKBP-type peptidyl-prolyl cis-trans isomerase 2